MSVEVFFDSNVLLYLFDAVNHRKRKIADRLVDEAIVDRSAVISYQVAQEVLNVLAKRIDPRMSVADASRFLADTLEPLWGVQPSARLLRSALSVRERYGFSFYDSLIVAAALSAGCTRLLSEDLQQRAAHRRAYDREPIPASVR